MPSTATPKLYFENKVGRLLEHPDGYAIFAYHPGERQLSDLQALLTHTRNLLERNQWHRMLGDQRLMSPFTAEESAWIVDYWLDGSRQRPSGLYAAVLVSPDDFALLPPDQAQQEIKVAALTYRLFDTLAPAETWLRQLA